MSIRRDQVTSAVGLKLLTSREAIDAAENHLADAKPLGALLPPAPKCLDPGGAANGENPSTRQLDFRCAHHRVGFGGNHKPV